MISIIVFFFVVVGVTLSLPMIGVGIAMLVVRAKERRFLKAFNGPRGG